MIETEMVAVSRETPRASNRPGAVNPRSWVVARRTTNAATGTAR